MCALLYKPFVLGYISVALLLQLLIYFRKLILVPRGMDNGVMIMFLAAILMSQRLSLGGSMLARLLILAGIFLLFLGASKVLYPGQYKSLITLKGNQSFEEILEDEESYDENRGVFNLSTPESKSRISEKIALGKAPVFELFMAGILAGLLLYFMVN